MRALPHLLLLLALVAPLAAAQVPTLPVSGCGPIELPAAPAAPAALRNGESVDIVVDVRNAGTLDATVTVTASTSTPGWAIATVPSPVSVGSGATQSFTFTVEAQDAASADAVVSFAASGSCDAPGGLPCPGTSCSAGTQNTQVTIPYRADEGFRIPGLDTLNIPLEYLIAAVVLVGLASAIPFAMRAHRGSVVASCPEPLKLVKPGRGTSFPIEIRNSGKSPATMIFDVGSVPEGWSAFMPLPEVQLAGREARSLWLMVRSPADAAIGEAVEVELQLKDADGKAGSSLRVRAEVQS